MALTQVSDAGLVKPASDLQDNEKIVLGTGNDLEIYHDATNSVIDNKTGDLYIKSVSDIFITPGTTEAGVYIRHNGAVEFYHDNVKKFETTSTGASMGGLLNFNNSGDKILLPDSGKIILGGSLDLQIYHDSNHSYLHNNTGRLRFEADNLGFGFYKGAGAATVAMFNIDAECSLYYNNSKKFETTTSGISVTGSVIASSNVQIGDSDEFVAGAGNDLRLWHDGTNSYIKNYTGDLYIQGDGDDLYLRASDNLTLYTQTSDQAVNCTGDAGVELYYDNSKKLETTSTGVTVTGEVSLNGNLLMNHADNHKIFLGAGDDLQIYHTGSHSYIKDAGTGSLVLATDSFFLKNAADNETLIKGTENGAVEIYYDNSKKFETTSDGTMFYGVLKNENDGVSNRITLGAANDLNFYHDGSNSYIKNNVGVLYIHNDDTNSNKGVCILNDYFWINNEANTENIVTAQANGAVNLFYDGSKKFETYSGGVEFHGNLKNETDGSSNGIYLGASNDLQLYHNAGDSFIRNGGGSGYLMIENTSGNAYLRASNDVEIQPQGGENGIKVIHNGGVELFYDSSRKFGLHSNGTFAYTMLPYVDNADDLGGSSHRWDDVYATNGSIQTSDRNEKNTIVESDLGLSFVNKLKPVSYKFNDKTRTHYGLIAQDVETILSDISKPTTGFAGFIKEDIPTQLYIKEDEIPEDKEVGDLKTAAYTTYGLRYNEFISPLIKAVQELSTEVETLKTKVAALGG